MASRDKLAERCGPFLPPGSQIRQVLICQTAPSPWFFLITYLTGLTMFWIKYRCVAVTQDAVYVLESSKPSGGAKPKSLVGMLSRQTQLGPVCGRWGQVNLLGERHWVHKRFHQDVAAIDYEAGFTRSTTPRVNTGPSQTRDFDWGGVAGTIPARAGLSHFDGQAAL